MPSLRFALRAAYGRPPPFGRFGDGHDQSALAALAALEGAGIEGLIAVADLGHVQFKRAEAGVERASFEAVGVAVAGAGARS